MNKTSTITELNLQPDMFLDMYVFTIAFENGDIGKMYKKKKDIYEKIGQEMEYTIDHKNKVKSVFKGQSKFTNNNNDIPTPANYTNNNSDVQDNIRFAQGMNLANFQYVHGKIKEDEMEKVAVTFFHKLKNMRQIINRYSGSSEVEEKTKTESDLPF